MRGQSDICLLCRHAFKPRAPLISKRYASSRKTDPYLLPRHVIDLDAADSPFVRKADTIEQDGQEHLQEEPLRPRRLDSGKRVNFPNWMKKDPTAKVPLRIYHTTSPDLLCYSLIGNVVPENWSHMQPVNYLQAVMRQKLVQLGDSAQIKIRHLLQDFTTDAAENLKRAGFVNAHKDAIAKELKAPRFSKLHRMVSILSTTNEGCRFLLEHEKEVVEAIRHTRKNSIPPNVLTVLRFLNNMQRNFESKGLQVGPSLCSAGLYYATKAGSLPAVKKYLQIFRTCKYPTDWRTNGALKVLWKLIRYQPRLRKDEVRREALTLATGYEYGEATLRNVPRPACFAFLCRHRSQQDRSFRYCLYPRYILGIGESGLNQVLWNEWMSTDEKRMPPLIKGPERSKFRALMFTLAFLVARQPNRALAVLETIPKADLKISPEEANLIDKTWEYNRRDSFPKNSDLEWITILINEHYRFHHVKASERLLERVKETLKEIPEDPQEALSALQDLLVLGDIDNIDYNGPNADGDWTEMDGEEGLLVQQSSNERRILYWKPASRSDNFGTTVNESEEQVGV